MSQTIEISKTHAKKLGEIMEMMASMGATEVTREKTVEFAIDVAHKQVSRIAK